ncbi:MAG: cyclic nucleotide-binding domain-containing protein [Spirochaetes bacterium]|nr:cyclic nucleotide-binding domain-containing protein [Spirochaetota bacterium]
MSLNGFTIPDLASTLNGVPALSDLTPEKLFDGVSFFSGVERGVLSRIAPRVRLNEFRPGEIVSRHGMFDERFHVILAGSAWAVIPTEENPRFRLYRLDAGGFFGEEIVYASEPRESTILAEDRLVTLSMEAEALRELMESSPAVRSILEKSYVDRGLRNDLRRVPVFTNLNDRLFEEVVSRAELLSLREGETICREGEAGDAFYLIRSGEARVYRRHDDRDSLVAILADGQFFGEMSLLFDEKRNATVTISKKANLVKISSGDFISIVKKDAGMMKELLAVVEERREHQRDALKDPRVAVIGRKLLDLNHAVNVHLDIISQCVVDTERGSALLATLPGSRYPYVYPRDSACAARFLYRLALGPLKSGEIAMRLLGEMARFIMNCQRGDGYWGQRYGIDGDDRGIYRQEDNVAHGVSIICRYLLAASKRGIVIPGVEKYLDAVALGSEFARKQYYRKEIHLFYSTTSIHESAIEEGYTIWVNYAYLQMFRLISSLGSAYGVTERFSAEKNLAAGFEPTVERVFVQEGRHIRRLKPDGTVDLRPDITLLSPFFFGTGLDREYFTDGEAFRNSIDFISEMLWDPELGMLQRYLPFIEDPDTHIHAGNGPWVQYTAMLAQYHFHRGEAERGSEILGIIDGYRSREGYLCEHLTTAERFYEFKNLEWLSGRDFDKEFAPRILIDGIPYDNIVEELNHMRDSYRKVEDECRRVSHNGHISFATPLMWSHAEYAMALMMRTEKELEVLRT